LRELADDPYGARWAPIARILTECLPFGDARLREVQRETEQALLERWRATSSNRMRWQINLWLLALGSQQIPEMRSGVLETALRGLDSLRPQYALSELLQQTGYADLAHRVEEGGRIDQQAVTQTLIDIIADGPVVWLMMRQSTSLHEIWNRQCSQSSAKTAQSIGWPS
jgi:hypothetical protein